MKSANPNPNSETAIEVASPKGVARQSQPLDIEAMFKYAIDKGQNLDSLMNVRRELMGEASKQLYDEAMAAFQFECPVISKSVGVPDRSGTIAYKFATFEQIIAAVKPLLHKHGFSYALDTKTESAPGWVIAICKITHRGDPENKIPGHVTTSESKFPLGTKTGIMSETQVFAAALTFASRRVFCNAFGIVTAGEDKNGITNVEKPANPSAIAPSTNSLKDLAAELWALLKPVRGTVKSWDEANKFLWRYELLDAAASEAMPDLSEARMKEVIAKAKTHPQLKTT